MMEYSDENLMKLLSQASHQAGHGPGPKRGPEGRKSDAGGGGRVGYPNCPGPGCGNNCPYKGTQDCPKVAARNSAGRGEGSGEDHGGHDGRGEHGGHDEHGEHGDGQWQGREGHGGHGEHGDGQWQGREGHGEHGGRGWHGNGKPYGHGPGEDDRDAAHSPMGRERILTILNEEGSMSQNKLAEKLEIRPQSVSELLGKLESDGYITRTQNDQDKRETLVSLSEEGKKRADEVKDLQAKHTAEFLAPLSEEEKQTLFGLLSKLTGEKTEA